MLPKQYRLPLKTDFLRVKKSGRYLNSELLTILYAPSPTLRFGFIVSNKISNKATKRNRIKRLLREAARSLISGIKKPYDFIIIAKPKILGKSLVEIKKELRGLFNSLTMKQLNN